MALKKLVEDVFAGQDWGRVCQRRNYYIRKKLIFTVILVFLNFYFIINKKIGYALNRCTKQSMA
jgi:hypothetical protein